VLGASFDTPEQNEAFARKFSYPFPLLCDTRREIGLAYGACDTPDAEYARRISYLIGPDGRIEKAWPKVTPSTHPQEVLASL
jgi:peroxiredoxin Q/BCP